MSSKISKNIRSKNPRVFQNFGKHIYLLIWKTHGNNTFLKYLPYCIYQYGTFWHNVNIHQRFFMVSDLAPNSWARSYIRMWQKSTRGARKMAQRMGADHVEDGSIGLEIAGINQLSHEY